MKKSWKCVVRLNVFTKTCLTINDFSRDPYFMILAWVQSGNIFEKLMKVCSSPEFFYKNMSHEQLVFTWFTFRDSSMGTKLKHFWKTYETMKSARIFHKNMSHEQLPFTRSIFRDSSMGKSWNIFEKLMKLWSPPEFFHKNMSHKHLPFTWSTFRECSMGTKLKYFWKTQETVKSAWNFSQKHVSRTIIFPVIHISWF